MQFLYYWDPSPIIPSDSDEEEDEPEAGPSHMAQALNPAQIAAIAAAVAQAFTNVGLAPNQPLQVTFPTGYVLAPAAPKVVTAQPEEYSGRDDFDRFEQECIIYISSATSSTLTTDSAKILFVLSRLQGGHAKPWGENYLQPFIAANGTLAITDTYVDFFQKLRDTFKDPNVESKALESFRTLTQGSLIAKEFFSRFEIIRTKAKMVGPTGHVNIFDPILIDWLKNALNNKVVMRVMRSHPTIPATYEGWKTKAIDVDNTERRMINHLMSGHRPAAPAYQQCVAPAPRPPAAPQAVQQHVRQAPPPQAAQSAWAYVPPFTCPTQPAQQQQPQPYRDFQGVGPGTHPGMGIPMDVSINNAQRNRACYKCGQVGHFIRDCPIGRQVIQSVLAALEPEDRATFAEELQLMHESDFMVADAKPEVEVRAIPEELEEIVAHESFLAPQ